MTHSEPIDGFEKHERPHTIRSLLPDLKQSIDNGMVEERRFEVDDVLDAAKAMANLSHQDQAAELFRAIFQSNAVAKFMHTVQFRALRLSIMPFALLLSLVLRLTYLT